MSAMQAAEGEVEILEQTTSPQWHSRRCSLRALCRSSGGIQGCLIVFLSSAEFATPSQSELICDAFHIPQSFWEPLRQEACGFFGATGDLAKSSNAGDSRTALYKTWFRIRIKHAKLKEKMDSNTHLSYEWYNLGFFTRWRPSKESTILCFDLPDSLRDRIKSSLLSTSSIMSLQSPFAIHAMMMEHITVLFDLALWSCRDIIRALEKNRPKLGDRKPEYVSMHETARHVIHSSETLATSLNVVEAMIEEHTVSSLEIPPSVLSAEIVRALRHQKSLLNCLHLRSQALEERLRNEINLAFHMNAQYDSLVAIRIAEASQTNGDATKTISILGLLFLPGTFISAIFSMSFFNFSPATDDKPQEWRISDKFWIYWAVALPVTAATVFLWHFWQRVNVSVDDEVVNHREKFATKGHLLPHYIHSLPTSH